MGIYFFFGRCSDRTEGNCFKLKEESFRLGIRKKLLTMKTVGHRNRFSREVLNAPPQMCSKSDWMGLFAA